MARKPVNRARMSAHLEGDFVVFMTAMRINKYWKIHKWWPNVIANMRILGVLTKFREEVGFLGGHVWFGFRGPLVITYFRSVESLELFANDPNQPHLAEWRNYFKRIGSSADVAVWHEFFVVREGEWEGIYDFMPFAIGMARAGEYVPVSQKGDQSFARRAANQRAARAAAASVPAATDAVAEPAAAESAAAEPVPAEPVPVEATADASAVS